MEAKQIYKSSDKKGCRVITDILENCWKKMWSVFLPMTSAKKLHVTASQIRQDLNNFGGFGQQGYGYNVKYLYTEIGKILGLDTVHPMNQSWVPANLGQAAGNYVDLKTRI